MPHLKDQYIRALEYAESHSKFTLGELATSIGLTDEQETLLAHQIHDKEIFNNKNASNYINEYKTRKIDLYFSVEDKSRLLNYTIRQEARASSRSATLFAVSALAVSIISLIISAYLSYKQLTSPINIPKEFVEKIDLLSKGQADTNKGISELSHSIPPQRAPKEKNASPTK